MKEACPFLKDKFQFLLTFSPQLNSSDVDSQNSHNECL